MGIALLVLVLAPLAGESRQGPGAPPERPELEETARGQALLALKEIEFDRATGKLSDEDYAALKARYTRAALDALKAEEAPAEPALPLVTTGTFTLEGAVARRAAQGRTAGIACPGCGPRPEPDALFCSNCGSPLAHVAA